LKQQAHTAEVDLNYTKYYPWLQPYVSMYPKKGSETDDKPTSDDEATKGDSSMWKLVEKAMADGTLEALRDGAQTQALQIRSKRPRSSSSTTPQTKDTHADRPGKSLKAGGRAHPVENQDTDMDDESDDGFFEKGDR